MQGYALLALNHRTGVIQWVGRLIHMLELVGSTPGRVKLKTYKHEYLLLLKLTVGVTRLKQRTFGPGTIKKMWLSRTLYYGVGCSTVKLPLMSHLAVPVAF